MMKDMAAEQAAHRARSDAEDAVQQTDNQLRQIKENLDNSTANAESLNRSIQAAGWETYVANRDRWEEAHPYEDPRAPALGGTADSYALDKAKIADHAERIDRYDARMKAKKKASDSPVDDEKRFCEAVEKSRADVLRCYPQASDPKDILSVKSAELWKKMEAENNSLVNQADAPFIVFSMVATMLEIKPVMPR